MNTQYGGAQTTFFTMVVYLAVMGFIGWYAYNNYFKDYTTTKRILCTIGVVFGAYLVVYLLNMFTLSY